MVVGGCVLGILAILVAFHISGLVAHQFAARLAHRLAKTQSHVEVCSRGRADDQLDAAVQLAAEVQDNRCRLVLGALHEAHVGAGQVGLSRVGFQEMLAALDIALLPEHSLRRDIGASHHILPDVGGVTAEGQGIVQSRVFGRLCLFLACAHREAQERKRSKKNVLLLHS